MAIQQSNFDRRGFLVASGAVALATPLSAPAWAQPAIRPSHKNATGALVSYAKAIKEMLALAPDNPHNWYRQALVHLLDCPHGSPFFFPWHRAYIRYFEQLCRKYSGDSGFMLPFWDWTDEQAIPAALFDGLLDPHHTSFEADFAAFRAKFAGAIEAFWNGMTSDQKARATRRYSSPAAMLAAIQSAPHFFARSASRNKSLANRAFDAFLKASTNRTSMQDIVEVGDFETFSSLIEGPHGSIHTSGVGGFMARFLSPVDPIFWLHHANVDRQWAIWTTRQKRLGCATLPPDPAWANEPLLFFTNTAGHGVSEKVGQYTEIAPLGYDYANGSLSDLAGTGGSSCAPSSPQTSALSVAVRTAEGPNILRIASVTNLALDVPSAVVRPLAAPERGQPKTSLVAKLTVKVPPTTQNRRLKVFLNCDYLSATTPPSDPHYVGSYSFFDAVPGDAHHGAHGNEVTFSLALNGVLSRVPVANPDTATLKFQVVPEGPEGLGREFGSQLTKVQVIKI